jgi:predicted DNA binding CopG/RHH family protein
MNVTEMREKQLNIRLSEEEADRVAFLTDHHGVNAAALLRMLLKKEERLVLSSLPPGAEKKTKPKK